MCIIPIYISSAEITRFISAVRIITLNRYNLHTESFFETLEILQIYYQLHLQELQFV
jgi:hypothetical protein